MFAYCSNEPVCKVARDGMFWGLALAGGGSISAGLSLGAIATSIIAAASAITPIGWVAIGAVVTVGVISVGIAYAQTNTEEKSLATIKETFKDYEVEFSDIKCAKQEEISEVINI